MKARRNLSNPGQSRRRYLPLVLIALVLGGGFLWRRHTGSLFPEVASRAFWGGQPAATPFAYRYASSLPLATGLDGTFATQVNDCLIPAADAYGYDLYVNSGYRSFAEENAIYALGRSEDGNIVSQAKGGQSFHNFGLAVDLADRADGVNIDYEQIGRIASWCGIEHGDRGYPDLPHFQYRGDLSLEEVQAGMRPPPLSLPCAILKSRADAGASLTRADLKGCGAPDFGVPVPTASPSAYPQTDTVSTPPAGIPTAWYRYMSPFGFSFWYPPGWVADDSELAPFGSLSDAAAARSNLILIAGTQEAESDVSAGPSLTLNVATRNDEQKLLGTSLASSADWLNRLSTGLPSRPSAATVKNLAVDGHPAVRLTGLSVVAGKYEATYLLEADKGAAVRFDCNYLRPEDLATLDTIIQSFSLAGSLEATE